MSASITVTGNLTADPNARTTGQGIRVTSFRMASTERYRTQSGEWADGPTTYYKVSCWRAKADRVAQCLRRGDAVIVHGKLRQAEWTDREGNPRTEIEIEAYALGPDLALIAASVVRKQELPSAPDVDPLTGEIVGDEAFPGPHEARPAA
jgi:single-strand DNA-binding protein